MLKDLDPIVNLKKAGKLQASFGVFPLLRLWHRHGWSVWPIRSQWLCLLCLRPPKKRCERPMVSASYRHRIDCMHFPCALMCFRLLKIFPQHSLNPLTVSKPTAKLRGHIGASGSEVGDHLGQRLNKGCCLENVLRYVVSVTCGTDKYFLLGFEMDMLLRKKSAPSRHSPVSLSCHCPHLEGAYKKAESNTCHIAVKKNEKDRKRAHTLVEIGSGGKQRIKSSQGKVTSPMAIESLGLAQAFWFCADIFTMNPEPGKSK